AGRVPDGRGEHARQLPEYSFSAPEAAHGKHRLPQLAWKRRLEAVTVDEVLLGDLHPFAATGQRVILRRNAQRCSRPHLYSLPPDYIFEISDDIFSCLQ